MKTKVHIGTTVWWWARQSDEGFQKNGDDLVKQEILLIFKAINTWATESHRTVRGTIYVGNNVLLLERDTIISNCMGLLEILRGTEKSLWFYNWMFKTLTGSVTREPLYLHHFSKLYPPRDALLTHGFPVEEQYLLILLHQGTCSRQWEPCFLVHHLLFGHLEYKMAICIYMQNNIQPTSHTRCSLLNIECISKSILLFLW